MCWEILCMWVSWNGSDPKRKEGLYVILKCVFFFPTRSQQLQQPQPSSIRSMTERLKCNPTRVHFVKDFEVLQILVLQLYIVIFSSTYLLLLRATYFYISPQAKCEQCSSIIVLNVNFCSNTNTKRNDQTATRQRILLFTYLVEKVHKFIMIFFRFLKEFGRLPWRITLAPQQLVYYFYFHKRFLDVL